MKKYTVNVHYDMVATVEVEARNEDEAEELAEELADDLDSSKLDCVNTECCITNESKVYTSDEEFRAILDQFCNERSESRDECKSALMKVFIDEDVPHIDYTIEEIIDMANELMDEDLE